MKFNSNKNFPANKKSVVIRLCAVALIALIGVVILALIVPYSNQAAKKMTVNEVIARACLKNKSCTKHIFPRPFS